MRDRHSFYTCFQQQGNITNNYRLAVCRMGKLCLSGFGFAGNSGMSKPPAGSIFLTTKAVNAVGRNGINPCPPPTRWDIIISQGGFVAVASV